MENPLNTQAPTPNSDPGSSPQGNSPVQPVQAPTLPAPSAPVTPAPQPYSPGTGETPSIPQGLEKFVGSDGKIDSTKLAQSYIEVEKMARQSSQTQQQLQQTLAALVGGKTADAQGNLSNEELIEKFVSDPKGFIQGAVNEIAAPVQEQLSIAALTSKHREFSDPSFKQSFYTWLDNLPKSVQELDRTFEGADYLVSMYKERSGNPSHTPVQPGTMAPSGARPVTGGPRYSRDGMKHLMVTNPSEYARLMSDYQTAWREGRVDP